MVSPRYKNTKLHVIAVDGKECREIDENGKTIMDYRIVGKLQGKIIPEGVILPYHAHYINLLKQGSLLPVDQVTAKLAGVNWNTK
jgi:hypothetical protein